MPNLLSNVKITINEKLYVKDPETSELGRNILKNSILLNSINYQLSTNNHQPKFKPMGTCGGYFSRIC